MTCFKGQGMLHHFKSSRSQPIPLSGQHEGWVSQPTQCNPMASPLSQIKPCTSLAHSPKNRMRDPLMAKRFVGNRSYQTPVKNRSSSPTVMLSTLRTRNRGSTSIGHPSQRKDVQEPSCEDSLLFGSPSLTYLSQSLLLPFGVHSSDQAKPSQAKPCHAMPCLLR